MEKITYFKEGLELRELRIAAGFPTMRSICNHTCTSYRTWQNWELGISRPLEIVYMYLELLVDDVAIRKE